MKQNLNLKSLITTFLWIVLMSEYIQALLIHYKSLFVITSFFFNPLTDTNILGGFPVGQKKNLSFGVDFKL